MPPAAAAPGEFTKFRVFPGPRVPAELVVYRFPLAQAADTWGGEIALLGEAEILRGTRSPDPGQQAERLLSYILLRRVLGSWLGVDPAALVFELGADSRLHLVDSPGAPYFSLSRAAGQIALALAPVRVGVDVEVWQTPRQAEQLLEVLHPADHQLLAWLPPELKAREVTAAWTRKEASLKVLGTGLHRDPARDRVGSRVRPLAPPGVQVRQLRVPHRVGAELAVAWAVDFQF